MSGNGIYMEEELNGKRYKIIKKLGRGGVGEVWKVQDTKTNEILAYRIYNFKKNKLEAAQKVAKNLDELLKIKRSKGYLLDSNNKPMEYVILPKDVIRKDVLHFSAIMEFVDSSEYIEFSKMRSPMDADAICRTIKDLARVFECLHNTYGWSYNAINEGNIYIKPQTGEIKIVDFNIGPSTNVTIKGTSMYMAPEVVMGEHTPDSHTDKYSFAVFIYRFLVGGYPFIGEKTIDYCKRTETAYDNEETRKACFGNNSVFVWNLTDKSNSIKNLNTNASKIQIALWESLPTIIRDAFQKTFVDYLLGDRRVNRTSATDWYKIFDDFEKNLVICPHCHRKAFKNDKCCICAVNFADNPIKKTL